MELKDGKALLSGFCDATFESGLFGDEIDGVIVQIDGHNYAAYRDSDDGYRSYGSFYETDKKCTNTFPPQEVEIETIHDTYDIESYGQDHVDGIRVRNLETKALILEVCTSVSDYDSYYPVSHFEWHPENLPINKDR